MRNFIYSTMVATTALTSVALGSVQNFGKQEEDLALSQAVSGLFTEGKALYQSMIKGDVEALKNFTSLELLKPSLMTQVIQGFLMNYAHKKNAVETAAIYYVNHGKVDDALPLFEGLRLEGQLTPQGIAHYAVGLLEHKKYDEDLFEKGWSLLQSWQYCLKENNGTLPLLQKAYHELFIALEVNNNLTSQAMEILPQIKKFYANTGEYKLTEIQAMLVKEAIEKDYGIFLHLLENYIEDGLGISAQPAVVVPVKAFAPAAAPAPVVIDQANEMIKKKAADIIFNNIATLYKDDKNLCKETGLMKVGQDNAHSYENVSSFMVALASNKLIEFQGQEDKQKVEDFFKSLSPQELTSLVAQQLKKMIEGE